MRSNLTFDIKIAALAALLVGLAASPAAAWTTTKLAEVSVSLSVAQNGPSDVRTQARFEVMGGKFHGFSIAPLPGAELNAAECRAVTDDGRVLPLVYKPLDDGRVRVLFADDDALSYGAVTYTLVHRVDLVATGALRPYGGRARLDWTPLVWDSGTDQMTVDVLLPGESEAAPPTADPTVSQDYEVSPSAASVRLVKFRSVRWYPMQIVVDFDARLVPSLSAAGPEEIETAAAAGPAVAAPVPSASRRPPPPLAVALAPAIVSLLGLVLFCRKSLRVRRALRDLGFAPRYLVFARTAAPLRFALSGAAAALGLYAQARGSIAAGVPALVAAASLWIVRRETSATAPRGGGAWREMGEEDIVRYARLCRAYLARRTCLVDVSRPLGVVALAAVIAGLGAFFYAANGSWPRLALTTILDGAIWFAPAFLTSLRSELPVDPTLEGFAALRRWRRAVDKLVGTRLPGASAAFFVREDEAGPIEVRLRVVPPLPEGLRGIEIANELVAAGSTIRRRNAIVLRLEPGAELARRLAACPHVAEHHLSPDLADEILVLRDRRGPVSEGLAPLRTALAHLAG